MRFWATLLSWTLLAFSLAAGILFAILVILSWVCALAVKP